MNTTFPLIQTLLPKDFYKSFWKLTPQGKDMVYTVLICNVPLQEYCAMRQLSKVQCTEIINMINKRLWQK